jgi:hypothetical protein
VAHLTVRCARTVQLWTLHLRVSQASLLYNSPDCPVCHRTVRCTSGATATSATVDCNGHLQTLQCANSVRRSQSSDQRRTRHWTVPVRCGTELSGATRRQSSNGRLRPNPNDWVTWLASGAPNDTAALTNGCLVVEGYKYPQPPPLQPSKHSSLSIQYKSKVQHSKTQIKATDPIKVQLNSSALGLVRGSFLCFFVALVAWLAFFFLLFLFSKPCKRSKRHQLCGGPYGI